MDGLISRQAAIQVVYDGAYLSLEKRHALADMIDRIPTAVPTAEKRGAWIGIDDEPCEVWECDKCGHIVEVDATLKLPNYCENCGAKMGECE